MKLFGLCLFVLALVCSFFASGCASNLPVAQPAPVETVQAKSPAPLHMEHNSLFACHESTNGGKWCGSAKFSLR
jgi:hypothetical protein